MKRAYSLGASPETQNLTPQSSTPPASPQSPIPQPLTPPASPQSLTSQPLTPPTSPILWGSTTPSNSNARSGSSRPHRKEVEVNLCGRRLPGYRVVRAHQRTPGNLRDKAYNFTVYVGLNGLHSLAGQKKDEDWHALMHSHEEYKTPLTKDCTQIFESPVALYRVVISDKGQLFISSNEPGSTNHPFHHQAFFSNVNSSTEKKISVKYEEQSSAQADPVLFPGEVGVNKKGEIVYVSNRSGHYLPGEESFIVIKEMLAMALKHSSGTSITAEHIIFDDYSKGPKNRQRKVVSQGDLLSQVENISPEYGQALLTGCWGLSVREIHITRLAPPGRTEEKASLPSRFKFSLFADSPIARVPSAERVTKRKRKVSLSEQTTPLMANSSAKTANKREADLRVPLAEVFDELSELSSSFSSSDPDNEAFEGGALTF